MDYTKVFSKKGSLWMNIGIVVLFVILVFLIFQILKPIGPETSPQEVVFRQEIFLPDDFSEEDIDFPSEASLPLEKEVVAVEEEATPAKEAVSPAPQPVSGKFVIQVASFKDRTKAELILEALREKNYPAMTETRDLSEKGIWHRVYVGGFDTKSQAQSMLEDVRKDYPEAFVIQR